MADKGMKLKECLIAGMKALSDQRDYVNSLNVFPVPDGDTGTNMSLTMKSCVEQIESTKDMSLKGIAKAASNGSLMGARGNSGVILSQILRGFYKGIQNHEELNIQSLKDAFVSAYKVAYGAVMKPTEGTILTVARAMGEFAEKESDNYTDLKEFLKGIVNAGNDALYKTPEMLPILKEAGVVDAGGQGLMLIISGALDIDIQDFNAHTENMKEQNQEHPINTDYTLDFTLCEIDSEKKLSELKERFSLNSEKVILLPKDNCVDVKVFTNKPGKIIDAALKVGLVNQVNIIHSNLKEFEHKIEKEQNKDNKIKIEKKYGFVAVSTGAGLESIFQELGVDKVITGGQTMNPSTQEIIEAIQKVPAEVVYVFPNNKNIILAAKQARDYLIEQNSEKQVYIVETKAIPQAFSCLIDFDEDKSAQENFDCFNEIKDKITNAQVTYAVRDTEIGQIKVKQNDIIGLLDGDIIAVGKKINKVALDLLSQIVHDDKEIINIYFGEGIDIKSVEEFEEACVKMFSKQDVQIVEGGQPLYYYLFSIE